MPLSVKNVSKRFGVTQALDDVCMDVVKGEIHALLGENGAGKSTLIKVLSGVVIPDEGEIFYRDAPWKPKNPQQARQAGINVVYQELSLVPSLSVWENLIASNTNLNTFRRMRLENLNDEAKRILDMLNIDLKTPVKELGIASQQLIEIAGAVSRDCELLILDEPTDSLTDEEARTLFDIMRALKNRGCTIIFISHKIPEVFEIADRATIMKDGKALITEDVSNLDEKTIVYHMTGRELAQTLRNESPVGGEVIFSADGFSGRGFKDISFDLRKGEILGFAGLGGAGRTELCTAIFGANSSWAGELKFFGQTYKPKNVKNAMKKGIGYMPEDRKQTGAFLQMSIVENTIASTIDETSSFGMLRRKEVYEKTNDLVEKLGIKLNNISDSMQNLSGGNQQKVILSRWMLAAPKLLIADEPTRGIDVGSKFEIYKLLKGMAEQGIAIILVSSELTELFRVCDRIAVFYQGTITGIYDNDDPMITEKVGNGIMGIADA